MHLHCFINIAFIVCVIYVTLKKETVTKSSTKSNKDNAIFEKIAKSIHSPIEKIFFYKIRFNITLNIWLS